MENHKKSDVYDMMNTVINSIISLNDSMGSNEIIQLRHFLNEIAHSVPKSVEDSLTQERYIDKKRSMMQVTSSLDEAKVYLSMVESFGYGKTKEIKNKLDEFNNLLTSTVY